MLNLAKADVATKKRRSVLTNDPRRLPGVDGRTGAGRRFRDIVDQLIREFGDHDTVRIRELAGLKYSLEQTQGLVIAGDQRACEDLVRLSNLVARREIELKASRPPKRALTLAEKLRET